MSKLIPVLHRLEIECWILGVQMSSFGVGGNVGHPLPSLGPPHLDTPHLDTPYHLDTPALTWTPTLQLFS